MFVDGPEFVLVCAQLDTERNILTKFKKSDHWSWRRCDNKKCLQTDSWMDRLANNIKKGPPQKDRRYPSMPEPTGGGGVGGGRLYRKF